MPTPNFTPFTEPEVVAAYLQPVLERLALTFDSACNRTQETFIQHKWSPDAALSAYMIRKEVIESLRKEGAKVEEEDLEIANKALCGLLLTLPAVHLKIRKSKDGEIPAAGSRQSMSFYNWNLLVFPQMDEDKLIPLHLLLLWNDSRRGELDTLLLVCVEGNEWRWRIPVFQRGTQFIFERTEMGPSRPAASSVPIKSHFTEAFNSGNEDLPLKLTEKEAGPAPTELERSSSETAESNEDLRAQEKKKA